MSDRDIISVDELARLYWSINNSRAIYADAKAAWDKAREELTSAQKAYNAARGFELIDAIEVLHKAQNKMLAAAAALERLDPPRDE